MICSAGAVVTLVVTLLMFTGVSGGSAGLMNHPVSVGDSSLLSDQSSKPANAMQKPAADYISYALDKINEDRAKQGLSPVRLSPNGAAQVHAEDVLSTNKLSHWMTNGEKPYMTYTRYGGNGYVSQNVAISKTYLDSSTNSNTKCTVGLCEKIDVLKTIDSMEHSMVYDDLECCDDGHKHNILDKYHTTVSIGIAHDDYSVVLVQNFENNYIQFNRPLIKDNKHVQISGTFPTNKLDGIEIYYDKIPTPSVYEDNKARREYGLGDHIASVVEPWWMQQYVKPKDYSLITSDAWSVSKNSIDVTFDISQVVNKSGVYTVVVFLKDEGGDQFPASSYSLFFADTSSPSNPTFSTTSMSGDSNQHGSLYIPSSGVSLGGDGYEYNFRLMEPITGTVHTVINAHSDNRILYDETIMISEKDFTKLANINLYEFQQKIPIFDVKDGVKDGRIHVYVNAADGRTATISSKDS